MKHLKKAKQIRCTPWGEAIITATDDPDQFIDALLDIDYAEEFCWAGSFDVPFVAKLMGAGFLVMSLKASDGFLLLPKIHITRSVLFFERLHIKKSIRPLLPHYELRFNTDFDDILNHCLATHGTGWLTTPLVKTFYRIREDPYLPVRPVSFGVYRDGTLKAGEFGVVAGNVYTSYSGYHDESNAGTVQLILMAEYLQNHSFSFLDLGMPMDYKNDLGAEDVDTRTFVELFRSAQLYN
jgi:Leu/Phe-tRNA-protein transferase